MFHSQRAADLWSCVLATPLRSDTTVISITPHTHTHTTHNTHISCCSLPSSKNLLMFSTIPWCVKWFRTSDHETLWTRDETVGRTMRFYGSKGLKAEVKSAFFYIVSWILSHGKCVKNSVKVWLKIIGQNLVLCSRMWARIRNYIHIFACEQIHAVVH